MLVVSIVIDSSVASYFQRYIHIRPFAVYIVGIEDFFASAFKNMAFAAQLTSSSSVTLTSLNIGCTRHSQASLTLLSFARYFGIIQTSLASALAAPSVHSCVSISIHSRRNPNALLVWMIQYSVRSLLLGLFSPHL